MEPKPLLTSSTIKTSTLSSSQEISTALLINFVQTQYYKRLTRLQKLRNDADGEIIKLHELRKQLVEKNLAGVYSDEIFKEQIAMLEDRILRAQIAKYDETFEKYDIQKLTDFIKTLLADLGEAYKKSDISQKKALLGAVFPSGLVWNYSELALPEIRALYKSIARSEPSAMPFGGNDALLFAPIVSHFYSLMQFYLSEKGEITLTIPSVDSPQEKQP